MCSLILIRLISYVILASSLFLLISSSTHLGFMAEGRPDPKPATTSQTVNEGQELITRSQIGSRPPRCEGRCSFCGHCVAIQVPTNPQVNHGNRNYSKSVSDNIEYARREDNSNYKPMSWKCKCGNLIFNP